MATATAARPPVVATRRSDLAERAQAARRLVLTNYTRQEAINRRINYTIERINSYAGLATAPGRTPTAEQIEWIAAVQAGREGVVPPEGTDERVFSLCITIGDWSAKRGHWQRMRETNDAERRRLSEDYNSLLYGLPQGTVLPPMQQLDAPEPPPEDDPGWWDKQINLSGSPEGRYLCGRARVGHGHEGDPCRVPLGEDCSCQYHGDALIG